MFKLRTVCAQLGKAEKKLRITGTQRENKEDDLIFFIVVFQCRIYMDGNFAKLKKLSRVHPF